MAYENGGRSDKYGNRFENNWVIYKLLDLAEETISYVLIEAIGDDEKGVDLWIGNTDGSREAQQCKARNRSEECWTYSGLSEKNILSNWKEQLSRDSKTLVSLVSPLSFTNFEDITNRARNTNAENADLFYEVQIEQSGVETRRLFKNICSSMNIDYGTEIGNQKAVDYFSRMYYRQIPDSELKRIALNRVDLLFSQDAEIVYSVLLNYVSNGDILGKKIDRMELHRVLQNSGITYRNLSDDRTILPRLIQLNNEFRKAFPQLSCGIISRESSKKCVNLILDGNSVIIHGNAGMGKSGCTENIIDYCAKYDIPYIAIKLDKHFPEYNSKKWGENLGLPASISHCINAVSSDRKAVIILDQLDALRWTQSKSSDAVEVCSEIIEEVVTINQRREVPISIVVVCRTYDIENDYSIKSLFVEEGENYLTWERICVGTLEENVVRDIVGSLYDEMSPRLKKLLQVISNLYIWEHLNHKSLNRINGIETTTQLISEWWKQISEKARQSGIPSQELEELKETIVTFCEDKGRMNIPKAILRNKGQALGFLESNGILWSDNNKVAFVHQSILDSILSEKMMQFYFEEKSIPEIIGSRSMQTPSRRYQVQLFLQQLADYQTSDLVDAGEQLLSSDSRYSIKFVFLEVLAQFECPDDCLQEYVIKKLNSPQWRLPFLHTVIRRNVIFVRGLRDKGVLDDWMNDESLSADAVDLIASISPQYNKQDLDFIERYAFLENSTTLWGNCFFTEISSGSDRYFELKMSYYSKHPSMLNSIINAKEMFASEQKRAFRVIALMIDPSTGYRKNKAYEQSGILMEGVERISNIDYNACFEILFKMFPEPSDKLSYSDWSSNYVHRNSLERVCVCLIKKAARLMADAEPDKLLGYYRDYMGIGNSFYNELILDSLCHFPETYADYVLKYLSDSLELNSIEDTSECRSKLSLAFAAVLRYGAVCSNEVFEKLEHCILKYQPADMVVRYKDRLEYNDSNAKEYGRAYWPFWGYYQIEMLPALPSERMSKQARETLLMLKRNLNINHSWYQKHPIITRAMGFASPVHNKTISTAAWKSIVCNPKIISGRKWKKEDGEFFIESSLEEFSSEFREFTSQNPQEAISLVLCIDRPIANEYIDALYSGLSGSESSIDYSVTDVEAVFRKYNYDLDSFRAANMCNIVEKKKDDVWSESTYHMLYDVATNHRSPQIDEPVVWSGDDKTIKTYEMLVSNALNCVRGHAAHAIGGTLWEHADLYSFFKPTIIKLTEDDNPVIRFASLWCLAPILNFDQDWAAEQMVRVMTKDYRCLAANHMRTVIIRNYKRFQNEIDDVINKCMQDGEKTLVAEAGYSIVELYMIYNSFVDLMRDPSNINERLRKYIIDMLIVYLGVEKYREKAKTALCVFATLEADAEDEYSWSEIFENDKVDIDTDSQFISCILKSKTGRRLINQFSDYISRHHCTNKFSRELLNMCKAAIAMDFDVNMYWGIGDTVAKTIIGLYYNNVEASSEDQKAIVSECLNIWDLMYEKNIGTARQLTNELLEV